MKKIISLIIAMILLISSVYTSFAVTTMYAPDGRTANINDNDVEAWKNVGWYDYPVATVYAPDGRYAVISKNAVQAWKNVGWYDYPVVTMYAPDGRTAVISKNAVQDWKNVGWYDYPVVTVYAPDGRTAVISKNAVNDWIKVGWLTSPLKKNTMSPEGFWVKNYEFVVFQNGYYSSGAYPGDVYGSGEIKEMTALSDDEYRVTVLYPENYYGGDYCSAETSVFTLKFLDPNRIMLSDTYGSDIYTYAGKTFDDVMSKIDGTKEILTKGNAFSLTGVVEYSDSPSDIGNEYCSVMGDVRFDYNYYDIYGNLSKYSSRIFYTKRQPDTNLLKQYVGETVTVSGYFDSESHGVPYITGITIK